MSNRFYRLSVFALLILGLAVASGYGQTRRMKFMVKDAAGKPVDGVSISMVSPQNDTLKKDVVTDKRGQCTFLLPMEITHLDVVLGKEGFQKLEKNLTLRELRSAKDSFSYEESFLLYRTESEVAGAAIQGLPGQHGSPRSVRQRGSSCSNRRISRAPSRCSAGPSISTQNSLKPSKTSPPLISGWKPTIRPSKPPRKPWN